ncbi:hypothetical protein PIB30_093121 [Stylosanthes scabra]|uniref:Uncharacterized protein n=1 Tax=Stylosanthes scabra TaxID=79078 RepID=A0ABU6RVG6_9FABA|nr:hypothetical protein [Stylosanthes scabra]
MRLHGPIVQPHVSLGVFREVKAAIFVDRTTARWFGNRYNEPLVLNDKEFRTDLDCDTGINLSSLLTMFEIRLA